MERIRGGGRKGREEVLGREGEAWVQSRALPRKGRLHSRAEDGDKTGQDDKTQQAGKPGRPGRRPGQEPCGASGVAAGLVNGRPLRVVSQAAVRVESGLELRSTKSTMEKRPQCSFTDRILLHPVDSSRAVLTHPQKYPLHGKGSPQPSG
ncbi:uncharacterized protein BO80DRAFT_56202 [Aspergillus ibericus CBS 121593]|uniref:Uncharacterized protein n=1 Tax=Aspergillus ibericus CBS 121593 TaxID=1448316 RepID=A0A395H256_9EURO|nr:hypothetical protein BO80DRAFT_56202 [Aspergillus ibericus CBS 121593]RAL01753.1 hypothetical protein BO80DRAFT_56202 [Aspergillus ibericus CBS 121593]